jgi:hypothetical protein
MDQALARFASALPNHFLYSRGFAISNGYVSTNFSDVRIGSVATEPFAAKIRRCPFRADSDHQPSKLDPSFCANGRKNFPPPPPPTVPRFFLEFPLTASTLKTEQDQRRPTLNQD